MSENPQWEQFLLTALDKYLVKNDFPADANPKALRTLLWRTVCNMSKYSEGQTLVKKLNKEILTTTAKTLQDHKADANLVNAAILALSNSVFIKVAYFSRPGLRAIISRTGAQIPQRESFFRKREHCVSDPQPVLQVPGKLA